MVKIGKIPVSIDASDVGDRNWEACLLPQEPDGVYFGNEARRFSADAGMSDYQTICNERRRPAPYGAVAITRSRINPAQHFLHCSIVGAAAHETFSAIQKGVFNALLLCQKNRIKRIAIPHLDLPGGQISDDEVALSILSAVYEFAMRGGKMEEIRLALIDPRRVKLWTARFAESKHLHLAESPEIGEPFNFAEWAAERFKAENLSQNRGSL